MHRPQHTSRRTTRLHPHERDRLESLRSYAVLDTGPETAYDDLVELAAEVCGASDAALTFVDGHRVWAKAQRCAGPVELPRAGAPCEHVVGGARPLVLPDTAREPGRWPASLGAYAGVPLVGRDGLPLGALCVRDPHARPFTTGQLRSLVRLAGQAVALLELRRLDLRDGSQAGQPKPTRLRRALDDGELVPWFQTVVDLATRRPVGLEALVRWQHPDLGVLPPAAFMPAVEGSALVLAVGRQVLDVAVGTVAGLLRSHQVDPHCLGRGVAVNVSGAQLAQRGLAADVATSLARHGLDAGLLRLEITETTSLDPDVARVELDMLRAMGVRLVIDDYGTGWSGLGRVVALPVTALKLDRALVSGLPDDERSLAAVRSTLSLCQQLGLEVIAEGVETEVQRTALLGAGCHYAQGWLFSRAVPAGELAVALRRSGPAVGPRLPSPRAVAVASPV